MGYEELFRYVERQLGPSNRRLQPGCTETELDTLERLAKNELGCELRSGYRVFLEKNNGFHWNGVFLFGSEESKCLAIPGIVIPGFVERNVKYRAQDPRYKNYHVFGYSEKDRLLFAYKQSARKYEIFREQPDNSVESVNNFDHLITKAITRSLFAY